MIDTVWQRIQECSGQTFYQNGHVGFTYEVWGDTLKLSDSNRGITKDLLESALQYVPLINMLRLQNFELAPYIYSFLTDSRIREGLW